MIFYLVKKCNTLIDEMTLKFEKPTEYKIEFKLTEASRVKEILHFRSKTKWNFRVVKIEGNLEIS